MTTFNSANIDAFIEFWQQKPNSPEGKLVEAYNQAKTDFERQQMGILKYNRLVRYKEGLAILEMQCLSQSPRIVFSVCWPTRLQDGAQQIEGMHRDAVSSS